MDDEKCTTEKSTTKHWTTEKWTAKKHRRPKKQITKEMDDRVVTHNSSRSPRSFDRSFFKGSYKSSGVKMVE